MTPDELGEPTGGGTTVVVEGSPTTVVRKTADQILNNSATLQDDTDLALAVGAADVWLVHAILLLGGTVSVADWKFQWGVPAGGSFAWGADSAVSPGALTVWDMVATTVTAAGMLPTGHTLPVGGTSGGGGGMGGIKLTGVYAGGGTAGALQLRWAQHVATATDSKVLANSCLIAHKLS